MSNLRNIMLASKKDDVSNQTISFEGAGIENDLLEMAEQTQDIAMYNEDINRLEHIHASLESLVELAEASCEDGGLDRTGAALLNVAANSHLSQLEVESPVASMESFGGVSERLASTRISMEGIAETAKSIWEAILKALKDLGAKMKKWYMSVFDSVTKLLARAHKLREAAGQTTGSAKEDTFEMKVAALSGAKEAKDGGSIKTSIDELAGETNAYFTKIGDGMVTKVKAATTAMKGIELKADDDGNATDAYDTEVGKYVTAIGNIVGEFTTTTTAAIVDTDNFKTDDPLIEYTGTKELAGGKAVVVAKFKGTPSKENQFKAISAIGAQVVNYDPKADKDNDASEVKVATVREVEAICESVIKILTPITKFRNTADKMGKAKDDLLKAGTDFQKKAEKTKITNKNPDISDIQRSPKLLVSIIDKPATGMIGMATRTSAAALDYCSKSLAQYK